MSRDAASRQHPGSFGNTGLIAGQPADPRTYGLTIKASF